MVWKVLIVPSLYRILLIRLSIAPEQVGITEKGGTMRLGGAPELGPDTIAYRVYGVPKVIERHRHRYEVNNEFREFGTAWNGYEWAFEGGKLIEIIELPIILVCGLPVPSGIQIPSQPPSSINPGLRSGCL